MGGSGDTGAGTTNAVLCRARLRQPERPGSHSFVPCRVEDLTPGLLLFFARPSRLQQWAEFWGHPWRHVGITVDTDAGMHVASYSASQCYWCRSFEDLSRPEAPYCKSSMLLAPVIDLARRRRGITGRTMAGLLFLFCYFQEFRARKRPAYVCSTFVWDALAKCAEQPPQVSILDRSDGPPTETAGRKQRLLARWLCGPGDLWSAVSEDARADLMLPHLMAPTEESPASSNLVAVATPSEPDSELIIDLRTGAQVEHLVGV